MNEIEQKIAELNGSDNQNQTPLKQTAELVFNSETGEWESVITVEPLSDEELERYNAATPPTTAELNREYRVLLLLETDQYANISDRPLSDAMREYRQALRDITTHPNWPNLEESDWPVKPEE